jgi:hypothetical protein
LIISLGSKFVFIVHTLATALATRKTFIETFVRVYEEFFPRQSGFWRSYVEQVIYRYLHCGDPHNGFAREINGTVLFIGSFLLSIEMRILEIEKLSRGYQ